MGSKSLPSWITGLADKHPEKQMDIAPSNDKNFSRIPLQNSTKIMINQVTFWSNLLNYAYFLSLVPIVPLFKPKAPVSDS